jgi:hypothetical protein
LAVELRGRALLGLSLADGFDLSGVALRDLWWRYLELGGNGAAHELRHKITTEAGLDERDHDLIAQALNELFAEHGMATFPVGYRNSPAS